MIKKRIFTLLIPTLLLTLTLVNLNRPVASVDDIKPQSYLPLLVGPCGPGALTYSDDFSDPDSGWPTFNTSQYEADYHGSEFRLLSKVAYGRLGLANGNNSISSAYLLEVDVRNVDGKPGEYGVIFGFKGALELDFYTLMISPTGHYSVYYNEQDIPDPLQTTLLFSGWSAAIRQGTATNKIGIVHTASLVEFYVNGQFLASMPSDRIGSEQSGMMAQAGNRAYLDIRFDNFEVYTYLCPSLDQRPADIAQPVQAADFVLRSELIKGTRP